jgi:DNA invertase Pin-like site-specific DNA recombinase
MATYLYKRVSTLEQMNNTSLDDQERMCAGAAMMRGQTVDEVFSDAGISGSVELAQRPSGRELASRLTAGDTVIANHIDRMFRDAADALNTVKQWKEKGVSLIFAQLGPDPVTENGTAKMMFGMLAMMAEWEREKIMARMQAGRDAKKAAGGYTGGPAPFGYRAVGEGRGAMLEPVEQEQKAIARIKQLRGEGMSLRAVAERVSAELGISVSHVTVKRVEGNG